MKQPTAEAITHLRNRIHITIEGTDTRLGKLFDIVLLIAILTSVAIVMLDSVLYMRLQYGTLFFYAEWFFTILFTLEYALRLFSAPNRIRYVFSFFGVVDLLSVLPSYLSLMFVGVQYLLVIRILRILRIFRVLKLKAYMQQAGFLASALRTSQQKITVFFLSLVLLVTIFGSVIYVVEGPENGFTSIPLSIYWAIVTMTTVGYGDISPATPLGQFIASFVMILGYGIIAVPTGIVSSEMYRARDHEEPGELNKECPRCGHKGLRKVARYCDTCGERLTRDITKA